MAGIRIGGLASGMDIDSIVTDLMKAERMPLNKLKQEKQVLEWQRDDYREINTLLLNFRTELTQMKLSSQYRSRTTTTTDDTRVTATATGAAAQSSASIAKVTKLASSERLISKDKLAINNSDSLFSQTGLDQMWKQGIVESKSITADGTANPIDLGLVKDNLTDDIESWSVKVNGKSYQVVTDRSQLNDSSVYITEDRKLEFSSTIAKDSNIKVDYIAKTRTDKLTLSHNTTSLQLSRGSVNEISTLTDADHTDQHIKLTMSVKEGDNEVNTEAFFQIKEVNGEFQITAEDGAKIGTLDKDSGKINLDQEAMTTKGYLPPETPESGKTYSYQMELTYNQNYTNFALDTVTSKGELHENFLVQGNENISSVVSKINSSNVGVSMFYDEVSGNVSLTRTETGKFNINPDNTTGDDIITSGTLLETYFKLNNEGSETVKTSGVNAEFEINGITTNRNSNTFTIEGVTYTLKKTFGAENTGDPNAGPVTININNDSQTVFDNIKAFVDKYNELIGKIQGEIQEERYRDYTPLTDEQREQLSDKQQEQWEEKAKSGMLRRDPALSSLLSQMRSDFYTPVVNESVNPLFNQLSKIGIKTTANYLEGGKLEINETELKKAIEDDPASIEKLFNATGVNNSQRGIVQRLYDTVNAGMDKLKQKAGNAFSTNSQFDIGLRLKNIDDRIDRFESRLTQVEDRYWRQFTAMEKAIQQANSQSMYLMQQFSY